MRPPQTSTNLSGGAASSWSSRHIRSRGPSSARRPAPLKASGCGPVVAQKPIELVGPFFGEKEPGTLQLDRRVRSGDRLGEPMGPFNREVDVIRRPGNEGCGRIDSLFPRAGNLRLGISQTSEFMDLLERVVTAERLILEKIRCCFLVDGRHDRRELCVLRRGVIETTPCRRAMPRDKGTRS